MGLNTKDDVKLSREGHIFSFSWEASHVSIEKVFLYVHTNKNIQIYRL